MAIGERHVAVLLHERPHEPAGAEALDELGQLVELRARHLARAGVEAAHDAAGRERAREDLELACPASGVAEVVDLQAEAHVGPVGAEAQPSPRRSRIRGHGGGGASKPASSNTRAQHPLDHAR